MPKSPATFRRFLAVTTAISMMLPALPATAQDASSNTAPPPTRVGEIASITGNVSYTGAGSNGQWTTATANYPIAAGDSLYTQDGGQAALAIDSSRITMASDTELQMTGLDQNAMTATESQGEVFFSLNYLQPNQSFVVNTPRGTVTMSQNGNYDIQAGDQNDPTVITVLNGAATVTAPGSSLQVAAGQAGVLSGTDQTTAQLGTAQRDSFMTQVMAQNAPPTPSYAPPVVQQMTGVSYLGQYGSWDQSSQYGAVWYPSVSSGWAPYREGHWAYIAPWGYTWVDNEPWGFAPFHYGRWIDVNSRWGWVPAASYSPDGGYGPYYQPVYAPAVVSFFGLGIAAGITVAALSSGSIGWVPLGPNEPYYPSYGYSQDYFRRINYANVRNVNVINIHNTTINNYNNFSNRRGATYIPATDMSRGAQVGRYGHAVPQNMLASARPVGGADFHGGQNGGPANHGGPAGLPKPDFTHRSAAAPQLSSFAQRRTVPPATISHEPAQLGTHGFVAPGGTHGAPNAGGFHPAGIQPPAPPGQHGTAGGLPLARPGGQENATHFGDNPGFHPPPAPPTHQNELQGAAGQPGLHNNNTPEHITSPAVNHGTFAPNAQTNHEALPQTHNETPAFHPQEAQHPTQSPQVFHPQQTQHAQTPQVFHPQETHAPAPQVFHPQEAQHPVQQFHPQETHVRAPHVEAPHVQAQHVEAPHVQAPHVEAPHPEPQHNGGGGGGHDDHH